MGRSLLKYMKVHSHKCSQQCTVKERGRKLVLVFKGVVVKVGENSNRGRVAQEERADTPPSLVIRNE